MVFSVSGSRIRKFFSDDHTSQSSRRSSHASSSKAEPTTASSSNVHAATKRPNIAIVIYSLYGHIAICKLQNAPPHYSFTTNFVAVAEGVRKGIEKSGGNATIYQYVSMFSMVITSSHCFFRIEETLSEDILAKMHAPPKPAYPILAPNDLAKFDGFIMGIPTRFGNFPAQWKARYPDSRWSVRFLTRRSQSFWDATGQLWATGALAGKHAALFVSSSGIGGGQESTAVVAMSTLAHHGILYVPLGYSRTFAQLANITEVHGGTYLTTHC